MTKIGRNEPCSCGSGKKYKKCCLIYEEQKRFARKSLDNLQEAKAGLMSWVDFESIFPTFLLEFYEFPALRSLQDAFFTYVEWSLLYCADENNDNENNDDENNDDENILDMFLSDYQLQFNLTTQEIEAIKSWRNTEPSIYKIDDIDPKRPSAVLTDIFSRQEYILDLRDISSYEISIEELHDSIIIATLLKTPVEGEYLPFINITSLPGGVEEKLREMISETSDVYMLEDFMLRISGFYILYETIQLELISQYIQEAEWKREVYREAAAEFLENINEFPFYSSESIWAGLETWRGYANSEMPNIKVPGAVAGALEYFISSIEIDNSLKYTSQKELAAKYSTSSATIAKYNNILGDYYYEYFLDESELDSGMGEDLDFAEESSEEDKARSVETLFSFADEAIGKDLDLAIELFERGLELIEDDPENFDLYFKGRLFYAFLWREKGEVEFSVEVLNYTLKLGLNEEQVKDVHQMQIAFLIEMGSYEDAKELLANYSHEESAYLIYSEILLEYISNGFENKEFLHELIKKGHNQNPYVAELLDMSKQASKSSSKTSKGKKAEAEWFLGMTGKIWEEYPEMANYIHRRCTKRQISIDDFI